MIEIQSFASGSSGNMYTIFDGETKIMIEAGISIKRIKQALDFKVSSLAGVLLSHSHGDHSMSIEDVAKMGVDCYMSDSTATEVGIEHNRVKTIENKKQFRIGTFTILPFDVQHDVKTFGFLIQSDAGDKLLFATDTYYIKYKFQGLTHLMVECNYSQKILNENVDSGRIHEFLRKRVVKSHFSLENMLVFLKANDLSKVQEIHLLHLSDTNSDEAVFKKAVQEQTGKLVYVP
ncbi:MBL fold metallo-hydrolase [Sporosarcina psychrophila]|uniref:MBL fold metallo-hydrolase n=1 Tax=Sporosarcina psychrophila TaxID=1476 RepID=UPI00078BC7F4|nr:MBL fold metallo-hydrolase [Sporosarcina psychrophila]AMQ06770.1 MBL fold metallo-hydrolase [Sporosarcina psychrophila]